jgi:hypothetical protein
MYFNAKIEIDPSQLTVFKKSKPTKLFGRLADVLTFGNYTPKQEHETFTAVSILQQVNISMRTIGVKNVIRLAIDNFDFYHDKSGLDDDLESAMYQFKSNVDPIESELFNTIYLVLEHIDDELKYLIEIAILRKHGIGEYPIVIEVNALMTDYVSAENESREELEKRIVNSFPSQESFDKFMIKKKAHFKRFMSELEETIGHFIKVDDVRNEAKSVIIRPNQKIQSINDIHHEKNASPIFYGYFGFDQYFFYTYLWASALNQLGLKISKTYLQDVNGNDILYIKDEGIDCSDSKLIDDGEKIKVPIGAPVKIYDNHLFSDKIKPKKKKKKAAKEKEWLGGSETSVSGACGACD